MGQKNIFQTSRLESTSATGFIRGFYMKIFYRTAVVETANAFAEFSFKNLHRFERLPDLHCRFEPAKEVRQPPFPDMLREIP